MEAGAAPIAMTDRSSSEDFFSLLLLKISTVHLHRAIYIYLDRGGCVIAELTMAGWLLCRFLTKQVSACGSFVKPAKEFA